MRSALRSGVRVAQIQRDACDGLQHRLSDESLLRVASEPAKTRYFNPWSGTDLIRRGARWLRICTDVTAGTQAELNAVFRDELKAIGETLGGGCTAASGGVSGSGNPQRES